MEHDIFKGLGVEIALKEPEDFLKVKETLTRIGIASDKKNTLYQSCHILHKRGRYAIMHFKELFVLDGKSPTYDDEDLARRDYIVGLLVDWNLVSTEEEIDTDTNPNTKVRILAFKDKDKWKLVQKYSIGK